MLVELSWVDWYYDIIEVSPNELLGLVLFLIFINDLDTSISSNVLKFADDTKLYRVVDNELDGHMLQRDLDVLCMGRDLENEF